MTWTDDRVKFLVKLWSDGKTCSHIAALLGGISRNAVIGKVHRLGLAGRAVPLRSHSERTAGLSGKHRKIRLKPAPTKPQKDILAELPVEPLPLEDVRPEKLVAFADLKDDGCRWIYGDPKTQDHGFCDRSNVIGLHYCDVHARRAYQPPSSERKKITYVHPSEKVFA